MNKKEKETIAQATEPIKAQPTQELAISSKNVVRKKKEVRKTKQKVKAIKHKQRKGKSLLTAFRINRMTRRMSLDMNRACGIELNSKYGY